MFIDDELADNDVTDQLLNDGTDSTPPVEQDTVDQTKAFAKRLKESTEKARMEERESIAQSFGYESWDKYLESQTNDKLSNKGLDPETVKPILKELLKNDPEYQEAMKFKKEKETLEKEIFVSNSLKQLNDKFGTTYASINDLDKGTIDLWNAGVSLDKAFAANNIEKIQELAIKKVSSNVTKEHLKDGSGGGNSTKTREVTDEQKRLFKMLNPGVTDEEILKYINK